MKRTNRGLGSQVGRRGPMGELLFSFVKRCVILVEIQWAVA